MFRPTVRVSISHQNAGTTFGRDSAHRKAMFRNMLTSLAKLERITTTEAKAKEIKKHADKLVTTAKKNSLHARRQVASVLFERDAVKNMMEKIAPRFQDRPGGYTRVVHLGQRKGDRAPMMMVEFVDKDYVVPYNKDVRSKRVVPKKRDRAFPRRPNSSKEVEHPEGLIQEFIKHKKPQKKE